ncbi:hypothetical protein MHU86_8421 [Fragilaria crotonensis]|nr:hypothetical protein MHU86_8421 [Fragilaria crotonensis]
MGDTAGFVAVYSLAPKLLMVTRLTTSASIRERTEDEALPPSKKFGMYLKKIHPNQVEKIAISKSSLSSSLHQCRLVVGTKQEVELLDMYTNTILWTVPIELSIHTLDIHPQSYQVLCSFAADNKVDTQQCQTDQLQPSTNTPLWLMDIVDEKPCQTVVQPKTIENELLPLGNRCSAIWDNSDTDTFIMVTLVHGPDDSIAQELLQIHRSTFTILRSLVVPNKPSGKSSCHSIESLSQSPTGHLTLVSSTKGIQLVETATFTILRVFGDAVALHGHSLLFQKAYFVPKASQLQFRSLTNEEADDESLDDAWILGVPFANREPREFRDVLHLWDLWDGKRTFTTLTGPPKAQGFNSVECLQNQLLVTTQTGQFYRMAATCESDFGGIMYPPGYQVINDNVEYLEDEDEVDVVIANESFDEESDDEEDVDVVVDDDVAEALRRSMMEAEESKNERDPHDDEVIDVVSGSEAKLSFLPCRPEPYLRQVLKSGSSPMSSVSHSFVDPAASFISSMLLPMPHLQEALGANDDKPLCEEPKMQAKVIRAKRSKAASLEALLRSSLDADLRRVMMSRQVWADGSGSHLESLQWAEEKRRREGTAIQASNGSRSESAVGKTDKIPPVELVPAAVSPSEGSAKNGRLNGVSAPLTDNFNKIKMDVAAALLMSANGELDSPAENEKRSICKSSRPVDWEDGMDVVNVRKFSEQSGKKAAVPSLACLACRGRFVCHTCTKKEKPVDYDELERADEERKEKEEEEKRQARAEKRRLADAKRREARKKKKMEEDSRSQREALERTRREMENVQHEVENSRLHDDDKDRRRADMLLRLQAEQELSTWPTPTESNGKELLNREPSIQPPLHDVRTEWPPPAEQYEPPSDPPKGTTSYSSDWPPHNSQGNHHEIPPAVPYNADWPETTTSRVSDATNSSSYYHGAQGWPPVAVEGNAPKEASVTPSPRDYNPPASSTAETPACTASGQVESFTTGHYDVGETPAHEHHAQLAAHDAPEILTQTPEDVVREQGQAHIQNYYRSTKADAYKSAASHPQHYFVATQAYALEHAASAPATTDDTIGQGHSYARSSHYGSPKLADVTSLATASDHYGSASTTEPAAPLTDRYYISTENDVAAASSEYYSSVPPVSAYETAASSSASGDVQEHANYRAYEADYSAKYYDNASERDARAMYYNSGPDVDSHPHHARDDDDDAARIGQSYHRNSQYRYSPKATSEMLDPAEALASLAMFATTAVPMASSDGDYGNEEESYGGIGQYHHRQQVYEQNDGLEYAPNNNGWGNHPTNADPAHQGTSN